VIAPVLPCPRCSAPTPYDWERCGSCGAQRMVAADGSYAGFAALAGPWRRIAALLIDLALFIVPTALALWLLPDRIANPSPAAGDEDLVGVVVLALIIYGPVAIGARGRTLGKKLLGIFVLGDDGRTPTYPRAAVREGVGKVLLYASLAAAPVFVLMLVRLNGDHPGTRTEDLVVGAVFAFVGMAYAGVSIGLLFAGRRRRTLWDSMAGTACVRGRPLSRTAADPSAVPDRQPAPAAPAPDAPAL
jgi:uncharacterized RDD family membrane protein YckC